MRGGPLSSSGSEIVPRGILSRQDKEGVCAGSKADIKSDVKKKIPDLRDVDYNTAGTIKRLSSTSVNELPSLMSSTSKKESVNGNTRETISFKSLNSQVNGDSAESRNTKKVLELKELKYSELQECISRANWSHSSHRLMVCGQSPQRPLVIVAFYGFLSS